MRFLQLNPEDLRQPTSKRTGEDVIGVSGKNLAAALFRIQQEDKYSLVEISRELNSFIPNYTQVFVEDDTENKQYIIYLKNVDGVVRGYVAIAYALHPATRYEILRFALF